MISLTHAFGLSAEPFAQDVPTNRLFSMPGLQAFLNRFDYAVRIGAATVITGDVVPVRAPISAPLPLGFSRIQQSSGGLLRRANALTRGALLVTASQQTPTVTAEHVRLATTEIFKRRSRLPIIQTVSASDPFTSSGVPNNLRRCSRLM